MIVRYHLLYLPISAWMSPGYPSYGWSKRSQLWLILDLHTPTKGSNDTARHWRHSAAEGSGLWANLLPWKVLVPSGGGHRVRCRAMKNGKFPCWNHDAKVQFPFFIIFCLEQQILVGGFKHDLNFPFHISLHHFSKWLYKTTNQHQNLTLEGEQGGRSLQCSKARHSGLGAGAKMKLGGSSWENILDSPKSPKKMEHGNNYLLVLKSKEKSEMILQTSSKILEHLSFEWWFHRRKWGEISWKRGRGDCGGVARSETDGVRAKCWGTGWVVVMRSYKKGWLER